MYINKDVKLFFLDIESYPQDYVWQGSTYLVGKTFDSLQEMFTSTKEIQVMHIQNVLYVLYYIFK